MPAPRRLTARQAGKNTRNLTDRLVQRQYHDGIDLNFVDNVYYTKAVGRPARVVNAITDLFTYVGANQGFYRGSSGLLLPSVNSTPRFEFDLDGAPLGLLEEISRANLLLQSQTFQTSWINSLASISTNAGTAPDGTTTADKLVEDSGGTFHLTRQDVSGLSANVRYTFSCFVKSSGRTFCRFQLSNTGESSGAYVDVNLSTGATGSVTAFGTGSAHTAKVTQYADSWWRIELTCIVDAASTALRSQILLASALGTVNFSGDGSSGILLWGAQLELGGHSTSYIPTTTVAVTRTSETFTRTLSTEYAATGGSIIVEYRTNNRLTSTFATAMSIDDGTVGNRIFLFRNNVGTRTAGAVAGGVSQFSAVGGDDGSAMRKHGIVFSTAGYRGFLNGALVGSVGAASLPTVTSLRLGNSAYGADFLNGHIRRLRYYPYILNDAEMIVETQ